jgi:alkanesulfonate monooxygenase SsuD/methylene tetrahydromethanopterin reductase-like flavin-dependent oxidoreductase (luciferase family)
MVLSVLDFCNTFEDAAELGPYVESLGYRRYWFAEHPPQPSAEIFVALLSAMTSRLRVGTGGIALRLRNISQSACNLQFLDRAFGDRIDMGFCMGGATPEIEARLAAPHGAPRTMQECDERVDEWISLLRRTPDERVPEIWSLGTSLRSAQRAAILGTSYAFSVFHNRSVDDDSVFDVYRAHFRPFFKDSTARTMLAFSGLCAATDAEAHHQIQAHEATGIRPVIWGSVATCADRVADLLIRYRPDELLLLDLSPSVEEKKASYRRWMDVVATLSTRARFSADPPTGGRAR